MVTLNLKSLRVFVNILEEGTLARAAEKMFLSQSAASRLIQILEDEFQTKLFVRDKKRLIPTPCGERFYPEALRILSSIQALPAYFDQIKAESAAPLKIICHPRLISGLVVPAMTRFAAQEPDVKINLEVHPRRYFGQQLMHDTYDIAVSNLPLPVDHLSVETLATSEIKVVLPKGHALEKHPVLTPDLVRNERYIALDETTLLRQLTDLEMAKSGQVLRPAYEVSSASAALGLVRNGLGVTLTDQVMFDRDLSEQISLRPWLPRTQIQVGFCLGHNTTLHPSLSAFQECLIAVSGEQW